jgi:hypothetical protein
VSLPNLRLESPTEPVLHSLPHQYQFFPLEYAIPIPFSRFMIASRHHLNGYYPLRRHAPAARNVG